MQQPRFVSPKSFGTPQIGGSTPEECAFLNRLVAVTPSARQLSHSGLSYYNFLHFGMNTMTGREWGLGNDDLALFHPDALDTDPWCRVPQSTTTAFACGTQRRPPTA